MDSRTERIPLPTEETAELGSEFEPFLQEWRPAPAAGTIVLTSRHLAIIGFAGMVALALMATLAYVAGRIASNGPSRIVMVDTAQAQPVVAQSPTPVPAAAKPVALPINTANTPGTGESFWQVGALDKGMATVSMKYLQENGLPARLEPVAGSPLMRVLVGPAVGADIAALKQKLDALGFPAFIKQY